MKLYLVRHATAIERGTPGLMDEDRPLIQKGRDRMAQVTREFKQSGEALDRIVSSPLVRAIQTAEILAAGIGFRGEVEVTRALAPGASPEDIDQFLSQSQEWKGLALVGHEPSLGELARHYLGRTDFPEFKKGAICAIEFPKGFGGMPGKFQGMLQPKSLKWIKTLEEA